MHYSDEVVHARYRIEVLSCHKYDDGLRDVRGWEVVGIKKCRP